MKVRVVDGARVGIPAKFGRQGQVFTSGTVLELGRDIPTEAMAGQWPMVEIVPDSTPTANELVLQALAEEEDHDSDSDAPSVALTTSGEDSSGGEADTASLTGNTAIATSDEGRVRPKLRPHVPKGAPTIVEFVSDPQLLGLSISPAQETLLRAIYGLELAKEQQSLFRECTGRDELPYGSFGEVTVIAGARAGKDSRIAAPVACYEAVYGGHDKHLSRGERGILPVVAQDQRAARIAFGYIKDYLTRSPVLKAFVEDLLATEVRLRHGMSVSTFPCTQRSLRGWSIPCGVMDELAFSDLKAPRTATWRFKQAYGAAASPSRIRDS